MAIPTLPQAPPATLNVVITPTNAPMVLSDMTVQVYGLWVYASQLQDYLLALEARIAALEP